MKYLEALYGSQYYELTAKGKNGASGRFNGNIFLSVFIILVLLLIIAFLSTVSKDFSNNINHLFHSIFGYSSGKAIGRLLAIPLIFIIYFSVSKTVGSKTNYQKLVLSFINRTEEEKKKATIRILIPFFIILGLFFIFLMIGLKK